MIASITEPERAAKPTRREEVRARLLAAMERLAEQGQSYAGLTVERLISEAGLSRSTFYTNFADKADLLQQLASDAFEDMWDAASLWWERDHNESKDELHEGTRRIITAYLRHRAVMRAVSDAAAQNTKLRGQYRALLERSAALNGRHISLGQQLGFINPDIDAEATGRWMNCAAERSLAMLVAPANSADDVERLHNAMTGLYWNILYAKVRS